MKPTTPLKNIQQNEILEHHFLSLHRIEMVQHHNKAFYDLK
jgi:hypothetical protein